MTVLVLGSPDQLDEAAPPQIEIPHSLWKIANIEIDEIRISTSDIEEPVPAA